MKAARISFSETGNYDKLIANLIDGKLLTENEIKSVCEKVLPIKMVYMVILGQRNPVGGAERHSRVSTRDNLRRYPRVVS